MSTIFEKIIAGELPASFVYRDDRVVAFMDIRPVNAGHVLVVPVQAAEYLHQLDDESAGALDADGKTCCESTARIWAAL
jgi:histidine triad (HIT) family protein